MNAIRKGYVDGPFGQIHFREAGEGPPLVLAHQSPVCSRMFAAALPFLAGHGLRAVAVDTPGYGESDVPPRPPAVDDYAEAFRALLDRLALAEVHALGHHTGAMIVCRLAVVHADRVRSVIFNGPPVFDDEEIKQFASLPLEPVPPKPDGSHLTEAWRRRAAFSPGWSNAQAMHDRLVDQFRAGDVWWYGFRAAFDHRMAADVKKITCPALILTNTGDDIYHLAQRCRSLRPDFQYTELEGGTHDIVDEQPQAWAAAVAAFVKAQEREG